MENNFKHTPGPWKVTEYDNKSDDGKSFMGQISTREGYSIYSAFGFQSMTGRNEAEAKANAKLIAAAPELLQACKIALGMTNYIPAELESQVKGIEKVLRDAIQKASA